VIFDTEDSLVTEAAVRSVRRKKAGGLKLVIEKHKKYAKRKHTTRFLRPSSLDLTTVGGRKFHDPRV
jgi:hypothetical protein